MLRSITLLLPIALAACTTAAPAPSPKDFVLVDPGKYKTPAEEALARQLAENDCKAKAISAGAAVHKEIAADKMRLIGAAQKKGDEEYAATFTACMNRAGFLLKASTPHGEFSTRLLLTQTLRG